MLSRICEEFHCLPWQAEEQLERDPDQVLRILELRAYRDTFLGLEHAKDEQSAPKGPLVDLWAEFELERLRSRVEEMHG